MKTMILNLIAAVLFSSCGSGDTNPPDNGSPKKGKVHHAEPNEANAPVLGLNQGEKWKADQSTNDNVASLGEIVSNFDKKAERTFEDYKALHADLNKGIEKMIRECRMKGADHDALHLWLEPLLGMVKKLGDAPSANEAADTVNVIRNQVNIYQQFFS